MQPDYGSRAERPMASRTSMIRTLNDDLSTDRDRWLKRAAFFHSEDLLYLRFVIPEGLRVLELGCGTGHLLAALKPSFGLGVDLSEGMIAQARKAHLHLSFLVANIEDADFISTLPGPFDVIPIADTIGLLDDCQSLFASLHILCTRETRLVIAYFSHLWYPALKLAEALRLRTS
jgi:ubiquinone/menaquinone biosynthesis C-methylase UbiE